MKKAAEVKYPHAASLFQFCRRVLDHKFGGIRVIDQDVGQILGFDPADCSHWKKGKKNIRSIQAMRAIAEHLGVDERLVVDVASGDLDDSEAFYEFSGYGAFTVDAKVLEAAKKDFYRRNAASWSKDKEAEFRDFFNANDAAIERVVAQIHERINFQEAPLYLPEVANAFPEVQLKPATEVAVPSASGKEALAQPPVSATKRDNGIAITYAAGTEMRPYVRYRIAKAMALHFLPSGGVKPELRGDPAFADSSEFAQHLLDVQSNIFAAKLLAPAALLRKEMAQVNVGKDIVAQLAEVFWVSKSFMNRRLKEILQSG